MRREFGRVMCEIAAKDPLLYWLYGDVKQAADDFGEQFPGRIYNMGIAEQAMTGMAAGMAIAGLHPVIYSLTPFITERNAEQWKLDVDSQRLPVIAAGFSDYAGHGITQAPGNTRKLCESLFPNTRYYEPDSFEGTRQALLSAWDWARYQSTPSIISLRKIR